MKARRGREKARNAAGSAARRRGAGGRVRLARASDGDRSRGRRSLCGTRFPGTYLGLSRSSVRNDHSPARRGLRGGGGRGAGAAPAAACGRRRGRSATAASGGGCAAAAPARPGAPRGARPEGFRRFTCDPVISHRLSGPSETNGRVSAETMNLSIHTRDRFTRSGGARVCRVASQKWSRAEIESGDGAGSARLYGRLRAFRPTFARHRQYCRNGDTPRDVFLRADRRPTGTSGESGARLALCKCYRDDILGFVVVVGER